MRAEELKSRQIMTKAKAHSSPNITLKDVRVAVFPNEADRIIFKSALSDVASHDVSVRADGTRTMAGIRHELSVKAIIAQMAREPSPNWHKFCGRAFAFRVIETVYSKTIEGKKLAADSCLWQEIVLKA